MPFKAFTTDKSHGGKEEAPLFLSFVQTSIPNEEFQQGTPLSSSLSCIKTETWALSEVQGVVSGELAYEMYQSLTTPSQSQIEVIKCTTC